MNDIVTIQPNKAMTFESLYVHFPFCETKCHYCDFYSIAEKRTTAASRLRFAEALRKESELWTRYSENKLRTLFCGGGTPSMTAPEVIDHALRPLLDKVGFESDYEWTLEANPSSVDPSKLREYRSLGVNRVSMGIQSLNDETLKRLGRVHSRDSALSAIRSVVAAGFKGFSVDLLCGVPGQTLEQLRVELQTLTDFPITHLSCYLLTLSKDHPLYSALPSEETQLSHLLFVHEFLMNKGFSHYETSNYARPGGEAQHNLRCWRRFPYLGLGPSAHSFLDGKRFKNFSSLNRYCDSLEAGKLPIEWSETLDSEQEELEKWMLALRLREGIPLGWLKAPRQLQTAHTFAETGLIEILQEKQVLRFTPKGLFLADSLVPKLLIS